MAGLVCGVLRHFQQYFNPIVAVSFIGGESGVPRFIGGVCVAHHFSFLCCVFYILFRFLILSLVFPMSLYCPLLIVPSVFSNVYPMCLSVAVA
jgi:hypothetical protein